MVRRLLMGCAAVLLTVGAAACGDDEDGTPAGSLPPVTPSLPGPTASSVPSSSTTVSDGTGPYDPDATMRPDLMTVTPAAASPDTVVRLGFPEATERGVAFVLERAVGDGWSLEYLLTSDANGASPTWAEPDDDGYAWEDVGIMGKGPDLVRIPPGAEPGPHRVCTANALENVCAELTIVPFEPSAVTVPADVSTLTLHVSNQSFDDDPVVIMVTLDGEAVVVDRFLVEGQHNWSTYELAAEPGTHEVVLTSDTGATLRSTVEIPAEGHTWAVADYWYSSPRQDEGDDGTPRSFTFHVSDEPIYFD